MLKIPRDFKEFLVLLKDHRVEYLIVGGYAVALYGFPRYTGDLDIFINTSDENCRKLMKVLTLFGFGDLGLTSTDFTVENQIVQLGYPPLRLDILTGIESLSFQDCWKNRKEVNIDGLAMNFIFIDDLIANKKATGRTQDLADVEKLQALRSDLSE